MRARLRSVLILAGWLALAGVTVDLASCNDGSTGCRVICPECACGDSCISCAMKCTLPKGSACTSMPSLSGSAVEPVSVGPVSATPAPDAGEHE